KPDISLPADVVEEIVRIDGLDNIDIPTAITMTPAVDQSRFTETLKEKVSTYLVGVGFNEILTNSITNEVYFDETEMAGAVKMLNNLSADMNVMRPSMLETGLEAVAYNLNRKNNDLLLFDFGKTYAHTAPGKYSEPEHLCFYVTGAVATASWRGAGRHADVYWVKGLAEAVLKLCGIGDYSFEILQQKKLAGALHVKVNGTVVVQLGEVDGHTLNRFDIRQPVFFADFGWTELIKLTAAQRLAITGVPRFPAVNRDLAIVVDAATTYQQAEQAVKQLRIDQLKKINLFDVFESEKLGKGRKSLAISFVFQDNEKTLTDREIDGMMNQIMKALELQTAAEIRK
ncbi:MAG TPA: phenylalanine--tRNA ligase subunit beta, partial [Chitinophagaceae bacterium]